MFIYRLVVVWFVFFGGARADFLVEPSVAGFVDVVRRVDVAEGVGSKAEAFIAQAREDLRVCEEAERQVRLRLQGLTAEPGASSSLMKEYADYLQRLEALSAAHRSALADLEGLYAGAKGGVSEEDAVVPLVLDEDEKWEAPDSAMVEEGSVEALEAEFGRTLGEFDDFLLREQDLLHTEMSHVASRAKAAIDGLSARAREAEEGLRRRGESLPPVSKAKDVVEVKEGGAVVDGAKEVEGRRGDPSSDDVVARQLREAAEGEKDPVLREKLWVEYEDYKEGVSE